MKERITYYDSLRGLAIIGVVFIHTMKYQDTVFLDLAIIFRQVINFAVPLFLALSGFFLAEKQITTKEQYASFLKKQIPRVYLPYLIWSLVYIFANFAVSSDIRIDKALLNLLFFQTIPIFYFVALIIQYYFLQPLLKKYLSRKLLYLSVVISLSACVGVFAFEYYAGSSIPLIMYAGNGFTWLMFFVLGMYLKLNKLKVAKSTVGILVLIALALSILETYGQIKFLGSVGSARSAVKVSSFLYSAFVIIFVLNFQFPKKMILHDLGKVSYAVYLIHLLVLMIITKIALYFKIPYNSFYTEIVLGTFTILIAYLFCIILRAINKNLASKYLGI